MSSASSLSSGASTPAQSVEEVIRIPKLIRAVTNPDEFEPFPLVGDAATFEKCWNENRPWVLANLAHAAYHPHEKIEKLLVAFGAKTIRFHDERACLAVSPPPHD